MFACKYLRNYLFTVRRWNHYSKRRLTQLPGQTVWHKKPVVLSRNIANSLFRKFSKETYVLNEKLNTVNEEDVARHENITDWWDENGSMKPLHRMNEIRIALIRNGLENTGVLKPIDVENNAQYLSGFKIIEVGCGAGIMAEPLARLGADVTGIDPSAKLIGIAKEHATHSESISNNPPNYVCSDIESYAPNNLDKFDALVLSEVIEHVVDKECFLATCLKTLKPGGSIFLTTPNRNTISWFCHRLAEDVLGLVPKGIHDWSIYITPEELEQMLYKLGCQTVLVNGVYYNVFTSKWIWSSNTLHYVLHAVKTKSSC